MPKKSRTKHAVLAWLANRRRSGYDIHRAMEVSTDYFWRESFGQIYPGLKQLEAEGFVRRTTEVSDGGQTRHEYEITNAGRDELQRWLRDEPEPELGRSELLLKLFFGANVGPEPCREHVARYLDEQRRTLEQAEGMEASLLSRPGDNPDWAYWRMTLRMGIYRCRANVAWAEETLVALDELEAQERARARHSA